MVGGDGVLLIDSSACRPHATALSADVKRLTDRPGRDIVDTHSH